MKKKRIYLLLVLIMIVSLFVGCGTNNTAKEEADTISVYLWTNAMYEKYVPYIQSQLPDINIQKAMRVLDVMISEEGQMLLPTG